LADEKDTRRIDSILSNLMHTPRFGKATAGRDLRRGPRGTSFGVPLIEQDDGGFLIDMSAVRVFSGLPGFVSLLARQVLEQSRNSSVDVLVQVIVDPGTTAELAALGVTHVVVYARRPVAGYLLQDQEGFVRDLRLVFDAVQLPQWGGLLFPRAFQKKEEAEAAVLFPFHVSKEAGQRHFMLVEHDREGRFLRITVEDGAQSRLFLKRIPHRVVTDIGRRHYSLDIAAMAEQIFVGIHHECQNQQHEYIEIPGRQAALFELLIASGLAAVRDAAFSWSQETAESLLLSGGSTFVQLLSKVLVLLEDDVVMQTLSDGHCIEMLDARDHVYIDLSRKGARLNIAIGARRKRPDMHAHLLRMPHLLACQEAARPDLLQDYRILLIHHTTSEVLGFVRALEASQCASVTTLFINYQGVVPDYYLEDILSLPDRRFSFHALQRVELRDSVAGAYILSRQYSPLDRLARLDQALRTLRGGYLESMRLAAGHLFFREAVAARKEGRKLLLIEDGGYVAPVLNRLCRAGLAASKALEAYAVEAPEDLPDSLPLDAWLKSIVPATFEHTANGYYQLQETEAECGGLALPAFTIASSRYKNIVEAEACAHSILSAVESIFNGLGKCMMHRNALVLGSRGNIGRFLFRTLKERVTYGSVWGLDLKVQTGREETSSEFSDAAALPEGLWKQTDLFLGVTGVSVLKKPFFERLIAEGTARDLFFASGSTKTIEFTDLLALIEECSNADRPAIDGRPVRVEKYPIKDPQNRVLQGHHVKITFLDGETPSTSEAAPAKHLYLLGDCMPINFLYYGVPGEVIDGVFEELFSLLKGVLSHYEKGDAYPPAIYALDRNIDKNGNGRPSV